MSKRDIVGIGRAESALTNAAIALVKAYKQAYNLSPESELALGRQVCNKVQEIITGADLYITRVSAQKK